MDIYILDNQFNKIGVMDFCQSVIWTRRYCDVGDFELYMNIQPSDINAFRVGNFVMRADDTRHLMVISKIQMTTDEENGDYITISGKSIENIISKRIVWQQTNLDGYVPQVVLQLLNENLISPTIAARKIEGVAVGGCCDFPLTIQKQITGENLLTSIMEILSTYKLGFEMDFDGTSLNFKIYEGVNRSYDQTDVPRVVFSQEFDNLLTSEYSADVSDYKNVALVAGEGEGVGRKTTTVGSATGLDRVELFVDAKDISSDVEGGTLSNAQYTALLTEKGNASLEETSIVQSFVGSVEPLVNYKYGIDYNLGDIVQVENEYGIASPARVTEIIESWDENGYSCIPTFNSEEV